MKLIFEKSDIQTIHVKNITYGHIIVAIINGDACILNKSEYHDGEFQFSIIGSASDSATMTCGNCYDGGGNIKDLKEFLIKINQLYNDLKIEVFEKQNWKSALNWLIGSAKTV